MQHINMHEAKTQLSKLVDAIESGAETEITIARNGRPAAMLVPVRPARRVRLGLAKGKFNFDEDAFLALDDDVAKLFDHMSDQ
ncbi:type II toxin-antitoxin system Phd/YefM family antitoxin [Sphingomonas bacterium]|uniref:type II toxin-antitoxin system Phd/YefM family antitoxin n=1 Tax=Sphingomonas bacterium TaxID=1895847 RepID=UPI0015754F0A|nr:type II toxin-antitoxin system prevent-host-death family antitoxin [Sphingomonas bacterium]